MTRRTRSSLPETRSDDRWQCAMPCREGNLSTCFVFAPRGGHRRAATFLCTHLCSHVNLVAALDHSGIVAPELRRQVGETEQQKLARWDSMIASRVPDLRFLLEYCLESTEATLHLNIDLSRIGASVTASAHGRCWQ